MYEIPLVIYEYIYLYIYICIHRLYVAELLINSDPQSVVDKISLRKESHPKAPESQELPQGCEEVAHSAFSPKKPKGKGKDRTPTGKTEPPLGKPRDSQASSSDAVIDLVGHHLSGARLDLQTSSGWA